MKCKQIFIEKHDNKYCLKLDIWTIDDKTHQEIPGTRSSEPAGTPSLAKVVAETKAAVLEKQLNCTYPYAERF